MHTYAHEVQSTQLTKNSNTQQSSCLKSIIGNILKSPIININFGNNCIPYRHTLFGQTTKQTLNNFKSQKP